MEPGAKSPDLPIQLAEKTGLEECGDLAPYVQYRSHEPWTKREREHSRNGSNASSVTMNDSAYDAYWDTLQKRARLTNSVVSTDSTCRDSGSDYGSKDPVQTDSRSRGKSVGSVSSVDSGTSQYSQTSERIIINNIWMPPQFSTPTQPPSTVG